MEKSNNHPCVSPESGPKMFQKMREQIASGDLPEVPQETDRPPLPDTLKIKKPEKVLKNTPTSTSASTFENGASAMDNWQREQEAREEKRWDKAA